MLQTKLKGSGPNDNIEGQIDPSYQALRTSQRPLEFTDSSGNPGGHYYLTAISGTIAASLGANSVLFSIRWTDAAKRFILLGLRAGLGVYTAGQTVANPLELEAVIARGFTVDFTTNATTITPANGTQRARGDMMSNSFLSTNSGVKICTTTGMTGMTYTLDTAGFGFCTYPGNALGVADTKDLYIIDPLRHPIVLAQNEGIIIRNSGAFGAAATFKLGVTVIWAEAPQY